MNIFYRHVSFDDVLSYGTIFYGTLFRSKNEYSIIKNEIFSVEDIFYYKGDDISNYNYGDKLNIIKNIFNRSILKNIYYDTEQSSINIKNKYGYIDNLINNLYIFFDNSNDDFLYLNDYDMVLTYLN